MVVIYFESPKYSEEFITRFIDDIIDIQVVKSKNKLLETYVELDKITDEMRLMLSSPFMAGNFKVIKK